MWTMLSKPSKTKETATKDTKRNKMRIFPTSKLDYLRDQLRNIWSEITNSKDVNRAYGRFIDKMKTLIEEILTFKTIQQHDMKPWNTQAMRISARRKNVLYHLKNEGEISTGYYEKYSGILKRVVRAAKLLSSEVRLD
ncbi:hypothetical protein HHI36_021773 [Cryptolaemus montrouzieri]|uniref:Uncharacterized protein n=1 Tax=Cryptolaemus montrouzieri TaxID=559131 RepID=A0ABD2MXX6_9CUCU